LTDQASPPARGRILGRLFLGLVVFSLLGLGALAWYVTTDSFQQKMRNKVVAELEKATGGRVELAELHTIPFRLRVDARDFTIHGKEAPDQAPFLHVDRLEAQMKIISVLSRDIGLHSLMLEHPVIHIVDNRDGTTNIPAPRVNYSSNEAPVEQLLSLSVSRIEIQKGELLWQDHKVPFAFAARDIGVRLDYSLLWRRYETQLVIGSVDTQYQRFPEFTWTADASLILSRGRADISRLNLKSGKNELHFTGELADFHDPQIHGHYQGTADLAFLAAFLQQPELRKGSADFNGQGSWNLREFSTDGKLQAKDIDWVNRKISAHNARLDAIYDITPVRLRISSLRASLLGGDLSGDIDVTNWQNSLEASKTQRPKFGRIPPQSIERGMLHLQLAGFPLTPALVAMGSKTLALDRLNFVGKVNGTVDLLWVGSIRDAETRLKLDLSPPAVLDSNQIPLSGRIDGIYRGSRDELEVNTLHLTSNGSEVSASGNLATTSTLRFTLTTHNLREWIPLIESAYGSTKLPFTVHGWASLAGNVTGRVSAFAFTGNLEVYDFDTLLPATKYTPAGTAHWDALSTGIQYSNHNFAARNGSLIHGRTVAHFDASVGIVDGTLSPDSPFTLHLDLHNADLAEASRYAGLSRPLAGTLGLSLNLSGKQSDPHGEGHFEVRDGAAYGVAVSSVRGDIRLANGELQANNLEASVLSAALSGGGGVNYLTHQFHLNIVGKNIDLSRFPSLQARRFTLDGIADFTARASGTPEQPSVEAHVRVKDLAFDKERTGDFYVDGVTHGRQLDLKAHSDFERSNLNLQGTVQLDQDFPADLTVDFSHLEIVSLLRTYLPAFVTGHSPIEGTIRIRGPLRTPRELKAVAEVRSFTAQFEHLEIKNVEPIQFELADQNVLIESFHLAGGGTDFAAHGRAHLTGAREMDLNLNGSVDMALLQSFSPKILSRGTLAVDLSASGRMTNPVLQGRVDVKNTFVNYSDFPSGLSDLNGVLLFDQNQIQIQKLTGTTGGGTVSLTGSASYQSRTVQLDLGANAQGVRLRYPPGVSSTANADLRLTGSSNSALLSGDVLITKLAITPGFDFGSYIANSRQSVVFAQNDSLTSRLRLDVHVTTTPELQMQTAIARLSGDADLRVRGTVDRPAILGRVEVLEGEISFNGTKYRLERGDVTFANPAKTQPIIDLEASTRVRDYDITVRFRGDASAPNGLKITWQSEPQLPEQDVIALLALGRTREEAAAADTSSGLGVGGEASNLLINEALNTAVSSRIQRLFGVSRVKIDPQGLANETSVVRGPQLTIEQQVASNITLTYSTNVSVSTQQIIQVEYNITRSMSIVALRDQNGVVSFDFKIRSRKK
jgi:translocation and assembly module TamB